MAFTPKTWLQRVVENPGRRLLTATGTTNVWDITREEGVVVQDGDSFSVANMNDLETRIDSAFANIQDELGWTDITNQCTWNALLNTNLVGVTEHFCKVNTKLRIVELSFILNSGRTNAGSLVKIPSTYAPSTTSKIVIGNKYDHVATIHIDYLIDTSGDIIGIHSVGANTGYYEFCHFMFKY